MSNARCERHGKIFETLTQTAVHVQVYIVPPAVQGNACCTLRRDALTLAEGPNRYVCVFSIGNRYALYAYKLTYYSDLQIS